MTILLKHPHVHMHTHTHTLRPLFFGFVPAFVTRWSADSHSGRDVARVTVTLADCVSFCSLVLHYAICHLVSIASVLMCLRVCAFCPCVTVVFKTIGG